jgi:hypothetical protein
MILLNLHNFKTPKNRLDLKLSDSFHIHPARWVIERGGVAFLMFVDSVSCCVFQWISCFLCHVCVSFPWVLLFFSAIPRKLFYFLGVTSQSDSGAIVLAHESGFFSAELVASVWSHLCQGFASKRHEEISVFQGFPAPLPGLDICLDCSVELSLVFGTARSWKLIEKITTDLENVLQEMLT